MKRLPSSAPRAAMTALERKQVSRLAEASSSPGLLSKSAGRRRRSETARITAQMTTARGRTSRSAGGSGRQGLHCPPTSEVNGTPNALSCCPSATNSMRSAHGESSRAINSIPHGTSFIPRGTHFTPHETSFTPHGTHSTPSAMNSTRSAIHWPPDETHSSSTAISSTFVAMNFSQRGVDSPPTAIRSCRHAGRPVARKAASGLA